MFRVFVVIALVLLFTSCSAPQPPSSSQKVFEQEDLFILQALLAKQEGRYDKALVYFDRLYKRAKKREYLYAKLESLFALGRYKQLLKEVDALLEEEEQNDPKLLRFKVAALVHLGNLKEAKSAALMLVERTKASRDYLLLADIYLKLGRYDMAIKYLEGAYSQSYDEELLDRISIILFVNLSRQKEAIAQLETHTRIFGCSVRICNRLLSFYSKLGDIDGMLSLYKRYYEHTKSEEILAKIIQIYSYKQAYGPLIEFLKKNKIENEILLELYAQVGEYKQAYKLAYSLYKKTGKIEYLAQGAIYEYEAYGHPSKKRIKHVAKLLKEVVAKKPTPLYLNYLGYLLIDHNLDIKAGIAYVKEALKSQPHSPYYLDSLAWGYYKLGRCKQAYRILAKIIKQKGGDAAEIQAHYKQVKACLKKSDKKINKPKKGAK